jgi:hypothetical protein
LTRQSAFATKEDVTALWVADLEAPKQLLKNHLAAANCLLFACAIACSALFSPASAADPAPASEPVADKNSAKPANTPKVLSSKELNLIGKPALGYEAAAAVPDICAKLFCYCGCDSPELQGHKSLLDCFTCDHGVDCSICQEEAIIAENLKKEGKTLSEIQAMIDKAYSDQYPWKTEPTDAYKKYRASIKSAAGASPQDVKTNMNLPILDPSANAHPSAKRPHVGNCCGHNHS